MNSLRKRSIREDHTDDYMTSEDVHKVFTENIDSIYLLALLLTGDHEEAEQCFVTGVKDSVNADDSFRHWAHAWAKRAIIQIAIRAMHPTPDTATLSAETDLRTDNKRLTIEDPHLQAVLALQDFKRFVFVMSVLERYSDRSGAVLLGRSVQDICRAQSADLILAHSGVDDAGRELVATHASGGPPHRGRRVDERHCCGDDGRLADRRRDAVTENKRV